MAEFVTVMKERKRMCKTFFNTGCLKCPLSAANNNSKIDCGTLMRYKPEEAEKIIMEWAAEQPVETMKDRFFKIFPDAELEVDGAPKCCPHHLGWAKHCWKYEVRTATCSECWNRPFEERSVNNG